ncbi:MAG: hypothetical protein K6C13_06395 [Oscillospiraceae bacterium]|nr:hypothetical protein [Oscillospiraceae bacterium]
MTNYATITVREVQANAKPIADMVANFGSLSFMQARLICGDEEHTNRVVNYLKRNRIAKKTNDEQHVVAFFGTEPDRDTENCLWVAFRSAAYKDEEGKTQIDLDTLKYAIHPNNHINVMYIQNNKCHNVIAIDQHTLAATISAVKAANAGQPEEMFEDLDYIFVTEDLETAADFDKYDFPYPYKILYLQQTPKGVPKISTLKK